MPHNRQALQFGGWVRFFSLIQSPGSATDDALLALPNLSQDSTEACGGSVGVQPKLLAKIGEGCDRARGESSLQLVKGGFGSPRSSGRARPSWSERARERRWQQNP